MCLQGLLVGAIIGASLSYLIFGLLAMGLEWSGMLGQINVRYAEHSASHVRDRSSDRGVYGHYRDHDNSSHNSCRCTAAVVGFDVKTQRSAQMTKRPARQVDKLAGRPPDALRLSDPARLG
jgi:hypothetical protein